MRHFLLSILLLLTMQSLSQESSDTTNTKKPKLETDSDIRKVQDELKQFIKEFSDIDAFTRTLEIRNTAKNPELREGMKKLASRTGEGLDVSTISAYNLEEFWPNLLNRRKTWSVIHGKEKVDTILRQDYYNVALTIVFDTADTREKLNITITARVNEKLGKFLESKGKTGINEEINAHFLKKFNNPYTSVSKAPVTDAILEMFGLIEDKLGEHFNEFAESVLFDKLVSEEYFPDATIDKMVVFEADPGQQYGFDAYKHVEWLRQKQYTIITLGDSSRYIVSNKSISTKGEDHVLAKPVGSFSSGITFKTAGGQTLQHEKTGQHYRVTLSGIPGGKTVVYAMHGGKKVGRLEVFGYEELVKKLTVVSLTGKIPDVDSIKKHLDQVYSQGVVSWEVEADTFNYKGWDVNNDGFMAAGEHKFLTNYSTEMKLLAKSYLESRKEKTKDEKIIFVVKAFDAPSVEGGMQGYMPFGKQVGFITHAGLASKALPHELGHGSFWLQHTFPAIPKESSGNLMDYDQGSDLVKKQWENLHDPDKIMFSFLKDEEDIAFSDRYEHLMLVINESAQALGLKLGENAFVIVHAFTCPTMSEEILGKSINVSQYTNSEFPHLRPKTLQPVKVNGDVMCVLLFFEVGEGNASYNYSQTRYILPGSIDIKELPFLGMVTRQGEEDEQVVDCKRQLSSLKNYECLDDPENAMNKLFGQESIGLYMAALVDAMHACLDEQNIDEADSKIGDRFYVRALTFTKTESEVKELRQIADLYNEIGDLLFSKNDQATSDKFGEFFDAGYIAAKLLANDQSMADYIEHLKEFAAHFEQLKKQLGSVTDRDAIAFFVSAFSDKELEFLPMDLRARTMNILASKELRGMLRLSKYNQEELALRLIKNIKFEERQDLVNEFKKSDLLNHIDEGFNDLNTWVEDNYAEYVGVMDRYILGLRDVSKYTAVDHLAELYQKDRFYNLTDDALNKKYISSAKILTDGVITFTVSKITGYEARTYTHHEEGLTTYQHAIIEKETIKLAIDEPIALYHNAFKRGVDESLRGQIEIVSALKLHYYLQSESNAYINTAIWATVDVAAMMSGVGAITSGVRGIRLALAISSVASSATGLLATGMEKYLVDTYGEDGRQFVNALQITSAILGMTELGTTGITKLRGLMKEDVVKMGVFYNRNWKQLNQDGYAEFAEETKKMLDEFMAVDEEIAGLIKAGGEVDVVKDLAWIDDLVSVLPSGAKIKITSWVDEGLNAKKLKASFSNSSDKSALFNQLNSSKGLNHQKAIIEDYLNIPGVTQGNFVSNSVDNVTSNVVKLGAGKQFTMYPGQAKTFAKNASLSVRNSVEVIEDLGNGIQFIKIKPGTKVYRVFDGYKPWDDISMTGNTLPNGSFWTFEKPTLVSEVIEGTAVMPEWNGMTKIIEIEVPSSGLYGWYGKAAKQPASSTTTSYFLKGGEEQIIINFGENQQTISSIATSITSAPWIK